MEPETKPVASQENRSIYSTFPECPLCGGDMLPEHAHYRCKLCGFRDSCCD